VRFDLSRDSQAGKAPRRKTKFIVLAALAALAAVAVFGPSAVVARAAGTTTTTKYVGHPATISALGHSTKLPHGIAANQTFDACQGFTDLTPSGTCTATPPLDGDGSIPTAPPYSPHAVGPGKLSAGTAGVLGSNFNGLSDDDEHTVNGHHDTPPDQGLCVGPAGPLEQAGVHLGVAGSSTVVVELVNDVWGVYTTTGTQLALDSNADLFSDGNSSGDIECTYDKSTRTYFFTEIGAANGMYYDTNLAVLNAKGYSSYDVNTSETGYCFPDFPHQGIDQNALYITINEFCGANQDFAGSAIFALSKSQLVNHQVPNGVDWTLGINYYSFRAATGNLTTTEYLLASEQNDVTQNHLDVATVTGDKKLASGNGPIVLSLTSIKSESYSEPTAALSTGNGTTCVQDLGGFCSVPESWLDPIDMRLEQLQYKDGQLYTSLSTAMKVGASPTVVDGAAWFQVDPTKLKVVRQGFFGLAGRYMIVPSIISTKSNALLMGFSLTSPSLNPSSGYVVSRNNGKTFSGLRVTGAGSGPHVSFSGTEPGYMRNRWGDYSRIALDPVTGSAWMADEYIPPAPAGAGTVDNWGTRVWQVTP
jgi:hypothetical protein